MSNQKGGEIVIKKMMACLLVVFCSFIAGCPAADFIAERFGYVPEPEASWVDDVDDVLDQISDLIND